MRLRWFWSCAAVLCSVCVAPRASGGEPGDAPGAAQPSAAAKRAARSLANQGYRLFQEGKYQRAIEVFTEANRRYRAPTILFMLGQSHERLGQLVEAMDIYQQAVDEPLAPDAPHEFFDAQKRAQARRDALSDRIPSVRIKVTGPPGRDVQISIDGLEVPVSGDGSATLQNPGRHTIGAVAPGFEPATRTVILAEGDQQDVVLALDRTKESAPTNPLPVDKSRDEARSGSASIPAIVMLSMGAVGLGLGTVVGLVTLSRAREIEDICPPPSCEGSSREQRARARELLEDAEDLATISDVSFIAGGAVTALGLGFLVLAPSPKRGASGPRLRVGPAWVGVEGVF